MSTEQQNALTNPGISSSGIQANTDIGSYVPDSSLIFNKTDPECIAELSHLNHNSHQQMSNISNYQAHHHMSPDILLQHKYSALVSNASTQSSYYQPVMQDVSRASYSDIDLENILLSAYQQLPNYRHYQNQQSQIETSLQEHHGRQQHQQLQIETPLHQHPSRLLQQHQNQQLKMEVTSQQHHARQSQHQIEMDIFSQQHYDQPPQHHQNQPQIEAFSQHHHGQIQFHQDYKLHNETSSQHHSRPLHQYQNQQLQIEASLLQHGRLPNHHNQQQYIETFTQQKHGRLLHQHQNPQQHIEAYFQQNDGLLQPHKHQEEEVEFSSQPHHGQPPQHHNHKIQIENSLQLRYGRLPQHQNYQPQSETSSQQYLGQPPQNPNHKLQIEGSLQIQYGRLPQQQKGQSQNEGFIQQHHGQTSQHKELQPQTESISQHHHYQPPQHQSRQPQNEGSMQQHHNQFSQNQKLQPHIESSLKHNDQPPQQHQNQQPQMETSSQHHDRQSQQHQNLQPQNEASILQHHSQSSQPQIESFSKHSDQPHKQHQNQQPHTEGSSQQHHNQSSQHQKLQPQIDTSLKQNDRPSHQHQNQRPQTGTSSEHHNRPAQQLQNQQQQTEVFSQQYYGRPPPPSHGLQENFSSHLQHGRINSLQRPHRNITYRRPNHPRPYEIYKRIAYSQHESLLQENLQLQKHLQQQSLEIKEHLQQQNIRQQNAKQQPKRILQNPSRAASQAQQQSTKLSSSQIEQQETTPSVATSSQQPSSKVKEENVNKVEDKSVTNEESKGSKNEEVQDKPFKNPVSKESKNHEVEDKPVISEISKGSQNNGLEKLPSANTKDKNPLGLINEIVLFNKLSHEYKTTDEQGPAHKRIFSVILKLADEEYTASGDSIKKAQSAAATLALKSTKYPFPPPKSSQTYRESARKGTPTTELNILAMKMGESVIYKTIEPQQSPYYREHGADYDSHYSLRYHQYMNANRSRLHQVTNKFPHEKTGYLHSNRRFYVYLCVGNQEFVADGATRQEARNSAAQKALRVLRKLPEKNIASVKEENKDKETNEADGGKSEISLVHEIALRRNMSVTFEVTQETGPPHKKNFVTKCTVGDLVTEGEGNSKKTSKKKSAELMLDELKKLPGVVVPAAIRTNITIQSSKKNSNGLVVKSELQQQKADANSAAEMNPISRLIQIMQAKKKKEPVYTLVSEKGLPKREFVIQVEVDGQTCTGTGLNKKLAKRCAAEAMLQLLGYSKPRPQPIKSSLKHSITVEGGQSGDKRVTFVECDNGTDKPTSPPNTQIQHQRVPGLIHLPGNSFKSSLQSGATSANPQPKETQTKVSNTLKQNLRTEPQIDELCQSVHKELNISNFTKKHTEVTEDVAQITVGGDQQSFNVGHNNVEPCRDKVSQEQFDILLAKTANVHVSGDGPISKENQMKISDIVKQDISD